MSYTVYLAVMLGVIALLSVVAAPALLRKRCSKCGASNSLDAQECRQCQCRFPED